MIGQISQPQRSTADGAGQALRHTTSNIASYDDGTCGPADQAPQVGDSATSVGALQKAEFEDRQLLTSRSRGPGSGGLFIGQSNSLGGQRAQLGAPLPYEMGRMTQGALDRVNQVCTATPCFCSAACAFRRALRVIAP